MAAPRKFAAGLAMLPRRGKPLAGKPEARWRDMSVVVALFAAVLERAVAEEVLKAEMNTAEVMVLTLAEVDTAEQPVLAADHSERCTVVGAPETVESIAAPVVPVLVAERKPGAAVAPVEAGMVEVAQLPVGLQGRRVALPLSAAQLQDQHRDHHFVPLQWRVLSA